jgi:acyl dehydratase
MIDRRHVGKKLPAATLEVEAGRLRQFARAIGETDPVYTDEAAARAAGYRSLPAPPTFLIAGELEADTVRAALVEMGVDIERILHGEQRFTYLGAICAGDTIAFESSFSDIYGKRNGALEFIVKETAVTNQHGERVAEMRSVIVVRGGR